MIGDRDCGGACFRSGNEIYLVVVDEKLSDCLEGSHVVIHSALDLHDTLLAGALGLEDAHEGVGVQTDLLHVGTTLANDDRGFVVVHDHSHLLELIALTLYCY